VVGAIEGGMLVYLGCEQGDDSAAARHLAGRLARFRMFDDAAGKTNFDLAQAGGAVLLIPQFTLAADTRKGNRPSFTSALAPDAARELCGIVGETLIEQGFRVEEGVFGATMEVASVNLGPASYLLRA
jgi:D-tyrosyl-tRNA(Tyr) deacylase